MKHEHHWPHGAYCVECGVNVHSCRCAEKRRPWWRRFVAAASIAAMCAAAWHGLISAIWKAATGTAAKAAIRAVTVWLGWGS